MKRRDFLQYSGMGALGAATASLVAGCGEEAPAVKSERKHAHASLVYPSVCACVSTSNPLSPRRLSIWPGATTAVRRFATRLGMSTKTSHTITGV